jgi:ketosteroid isomerase-like protein
MASANVELVRSLYAAWGRGDFRSTEWAHPEIEWVIDEGPTAGSWTGLAEMAESFGDFLSAWEEYRIEAEEFRELDGERVLVLTRSSGRGKTSGLELGEVAPKGAQVFHIRGGRVARSVYYYDRERALADLGLKE